MKRSNLSVIVMAALAGGAGLGMWGCSAAPKTSEDRSNLANNVDSSLSDFENKDPDIRGELDRAAGYAILPNIGKAGLLVGGSYGKGEVYEHGHLIGYCDLSQGTIGLQAGAEKMAELIIFRDQSALDKFKSGEFAFNANMTAVAIKPGAAAGAVYREGVAVFMETKGGLMAEAAVGGQKIRFVPL